MRAQSMKAEKARGLYNQGITTLRKFVRADINQLAQAVLQSEGFFLKTGQDEDKAQLKIENVYYWCIKLKREAKEVLIKKKELEDLDIND